VIILGELLFNAIPPDIVSTSVSENFRKISAVKFDVVLTGGRKHD